MKKRSILLTCIVALMALAMFVGCDNAPVLPRFVVGGNITQTGDFLTGQTFDPSKFSITVSYTDGRIVPADSSVKVTLDAASSGKVSSSSIANVTYGNDQYGDPVTDEIGIRVYNIKNLSVTGPETYVATADGKVTIPASDLTVTATYLDNTNNEKTMILLPGEYTVDEVTGLTFNNVVTSVDASAKVTAKVGNFDEAKEVSAAFDFTATYTKPEVPEYALETVHGIKYNGMLLNLVYDEIPTPAAEDVIISYYDESGKYVADNDSKITAADLEGEVVLEFVDSNGNPLAYKDLIAKDVLNLHVRMTYDGKVYEDLATSVAGTDVKVEVTPKEGFTLKYQTVVGEAEADNFFFDLCETNGTYIDRLSSTDVKVSYVDSNSKEIAADAILEEGSSVRLSVEYMGKTNISANLPIAAAGEKYVVGVEIALVDNFEGPAKQIYDKYHASKVAVNSSDIKSVTINYNYGAPTVLTSNYGSYGASFVLTTDMEGTKLAADKTGAIDLTTVDQLYVEATYTNGTTTVKGYAPVSMTTAEVTSVKLSGTPAYTYNGNPMYGAEIDWVISFMNGNGPVVADYTGTYDVYIAGKPADQLPQYVTKEAVQDIRVVVNGVGESNSVSIGSGVSYVDPESIKVELAYVPLLNSEIKKGVGDYKVTFDVVEGEADDTITAVVDSVKAAVSNAVVLEGSNSVEVTVKYFSEEGTYKTTDPITVVFDGVPYVEYENLSVVPVEGRIADGKVLAGQIYNVDDFVINPASYTAHGDVELEVESVVFGGVTYTPSQTITIVSTATGSLTVNIKPFINANGVEVKGAAVELQVASSLN